MIRFELGSIRTRFRGSLETQTDPKPVTCQSGAWGAPPTLITAVAFFCRAVMGCSIAAGVRVWLGERTGGADRLDEVSAEPQAVIVMSPATTMNLTAENRSDPCPPGIRWTP